MEIHEDARLNENDEKEKGFLREDLETCKTRRVFWLYDEFHRWYHHREKQVEAGQVFVFDKHGWHNEERKEEEE